MTSSSPIGRRSLVATALTAASATALVPSGRADAASAPAHRRPCEPKKLPTTGRALVSAGPGQKWDVEGNALRFRGNTFVYPVPQDSPFFAAQHRAVRLVADSVYGKHFGLLPRDSMHMTLFEGVNQSKRTAAAWPRGLSLDATIPETTRHILAQLDGARLDVPTTVTMRVARLGDLVEEGPSIKLEPVDAATNAALRSLRRALRDITGIRSDGFETYQFHSTLGYRLVAARPGEHDDLHRLQRRLRDLFVGDAATVTLEPAAFCCFDDMLAFPQLQVL